MYKKRESLKSDLFFNNFTDNFYEFSVLLRYEKIGLAICGSGLYPKNRINLLNDKLKFEMDISLS